MGWIRTLRAPLTLGAASVVVAGMTLAFGPGTAGAVPAPGAVSTSTASCTFDGHPSDSFLTGITPGVSSVSISCTGLPDGKPLVLALASPMAALVPSADVIDEADLNALKFVTSTSTGTLPAGTDFSIPATFSATDPNAACPPTAAQINAGLIGCAVAVAEESPATDFGDALLDYTGQPTPAAPTLALGSTSARAGDEVTVLNGAPTGDWWGDALATTTLSSSDITVAGVRSGSTTASVSAAKYPVTVKKSKTTFGPLSPPVLGGAFTVPCGVVGHQTVKVTEPNLTPEAGTISATASLDVLPGTTPAVTALDPDNGPDAGGTSVSISGCNFTGATAVAFGTKPATSFHVKSDTSITAVSPAGTGTVHVVVTGAGGSSSTSSTASEFKYGFLGYDLAGSDGGTFSFGDALNYGSLPGLGVKPAAPVVGIAPTSSGRGYWLVGSDGGVYAFGDAKYYGSLPGRGIEPAAPIVGIAATADSGGYWLVGADGGVYAFGDARYYGSLPGLKVVPNKPIAGIVSPNDGGYLLVGGDGGVFAFGGTRDLGSLPALGLTLYRPVVGIALTSDRQGYWMVGAEGGVFAFGDAKSLGSLPGLHVTPNKPVVGIVSPDNGGYWLVGADGGVYSFGDAKLFGSLGNRTLAAPIVGADLA